MQSIWRRRSILLVVALGIALLGVLAWMWTRAREASQQQIESSLSGGHLLQVQALQDLQARVTLDTARIAEDPAFVAYVLAGRERGAAGAASITDLLDERRPDLGADGLQVYSAAGKAVAGSGELQRMAGQLERWDALRQVLDSGEAITGWWPQDGGIALLTIVPLRQGPLLEGLLVSRRPVPSEELTALFASSQLDGHLYAEASDTLRLLLGNHIERALDGSAVQQWRGKTALAEAAGVRLVALAAVQEPVWLLSTLTAQRSEELRREQTRLAIGLVTVATGLLILLFWIWRSGRSAPRLVVMQTAQAQPASQVNIDQRRGAVLQEVVTRALRLRPAHRAEAPAHDPFRADPRYQLISFQGESALARIYRVDDRQLNRVMLLFVLHNETPRDTARSLRIATELGKAGLVQHRNLVSVQRVARSQSRLLVVLDDVSGISLREVLEQTGPLPTEAALLVAKRIAAAQHRLNEAGVLLRQIDPDQVLFLPDGAVKLLPLALATGHSRPSQVLAEGSAEQWLAADRRSEVSAFGEWLRRLLDDQIASLPPAWRAVLDSCTDPDAQTRYASMTEVVAALEHP